MRDDEETIAWVVGEEEEPLAIRPIEGMLLLLFPLVLLLDAPPILEMLLLRMRVGVAGTFLEILLAEPLDEYVEEPCTFPIWVRSR